MTEHFVTLFNHLFLPQGVALHRSMERHIQNYILWILCVDDLTYDVLRKLQLANVKLLKLSLLETDELKGVKSSRTVGEYCWTLTPFAPRFVFEADTSIRRVTYLDADLWFLKSPQKIFDELDSSGKEVLITEHAYALEYDQSALSGKFCVQFMPFTRDGGEPVRKDWEKKCVEWCFARPEDGKLGDQKYLDDWPITFNSIVHILQNKTLAIAPWNAIRFGYEDAIFYHFHGLRLISKKRVEVGPYALSTNLIKHVYQAYFRDLRYAVEKLELVSYQPTWRIARSHFFKEFTRLIWRKYLKGNLFSNASVMKW